MNDCKHNNVHSACWMSTSLSGRVCAFVLIIVPSVVLGLLMQAVAHGV